MRTLLGVSLLVFVGLAGLAQAQTSSRTDTEILAQADAAFQQGVEHKTQLLLARSHFSKATDAYRELHRRGVRSPALYLNLGNAAVLADRWPEAIWAYHHGLKLDPNDRALREHLAFARAKVIYPPDGRGRVDADTWPIWLHRPVHVEIVILFALAYILAWIGIALVILNQSSRAQAFALTAMTVVFAAASGFALWYEEREADIDRRTPLVIVLESTPFHVGNAASYPQHLDIPMLPRGLEARLAHRRGGWLQVRLSTDEVGWVPVSQVFIVEP